MLSLRFTFAYNVAGKPNVVSFNQQTLSVNSASAHWIFKWQSRTQNDLWYFRHDVIRRGLKVPVSYTHLDVYKRQQ